MNISLVGSHSGDGFSRMLTQARCFQAQGHLAQVYVEVAPCADDLRTVDLAPVVVETLTTDPPAHWLESDLYIYHDPGPRMLLESVRRIRRGLVLWDCCAMPDPALVHYADLCLVETPHLRAQIGAQLGYPLERIFVIQPALDEARYGEQLTGIVSLALQDALPQAELPLASSKAPSPSLSLNHLEAQADVMLRDYKVRSNIPLLGGLVAWVRKNITSHLREPYLDPTLERQVAFNRRLVSELRALASAQAEAKPSPSQQPAPPSAQPASPEEVGKTSAAQTVIELRDPALDRDAILGRLNAQVAQRRASGAYDIDPAAFPPEALRPMRVTEYAGSGLPAGLPGLNQVIVELAAQSQLAEPRFVSPIPVVGPLIVAVRRAWNWMSTKWYVLPIIRQQSELNTRLIALLSELAHWQEINVQYAAELQGRVEELEQRLAALDKEP